MFALLHCLFPSCLLAPVSFTIFSYNKYPDSDLIPPLRSVFLLTFRLWIVLLNRLGSLNDSVAVYTFHTSGRSLNCLAPSLSITLLCVLWSLPLGPPYCFLASMLAVQCRGFNFQRIFSWPSLSFVWSFCFIYRRFSLWNCSPSALSP